MAFGIEVINTHGTVLIDDQSPALALREKRTFTASRVTSGTITITGYTLPVVAFAVPGTSFWLESVVRSGNSITYSVRAGSIAESRTVTAYCFDRPQPPVGGFGLVIYDGAGNPCFDSRLKTGRVVGSTFPFNKQPGRQYALVLSGRSADRWVDTGESDGQQKVWDMYTQRSMATDGASQLFFSPASDIGPPTSSSHPVGTPPQDWESMPAASSTALILDVTGY